MYWKYHIESGDHVTFRYGGELYGGTVRGWLNLEQFDDLTLDEVEPSDFDLRIKSGQEEVDVNLTEIENRTPEDERNTDFPLLSERFRLSGGIDQ